MPASLFGPRAGRGVPAVPGPAAPARRGQRRGAVLAVRGGTGQRADVRDVRPGTRLQHRVDAGAGRPGATAGGPVVSAESPLTISLPAVRLPADRATGRTDRRRPNGAAGAPPQRRDAERDPPADVEPADRTGYELPLPFSGTGPVERRWRRARPRRRPSRPPNARTVGPGWWAAEVEPAEPDLSGPGATAGVASTPDGWSGAPAATFDSALPAPAFEPVRPDPAAESPAADVSGHDPSRPERAQLVPTPRPRTVAPADDATATQSIPALPPQADRRAAGRPGPRTSRSIR